MTKDTKSNAAGKRVALYLRVSSDGQTVENQRRELQAVAANNEWNIVAEFADEGISGSKDRDRRPGYDNLCLGVTRREFDLVMAWSVCRLGRSLTYLISFLDLLKAKGVNLYLHQQGLDTTTPMGEAMFQILGMFSQFERAMIRERTCAGLRRARAKGTRLGRRLTVTPAKAALIRADLRSGGSLRTVAKRYKTSVTSVQRVRAAGNHWPPAYYVGS